MATPFLTYIEHNFGKYLSAVSAEFKMKMVRSLRNFLKIRNDKNFMNIALTILNSFSLPATLPDGKTKTLETILLNKTKLTVLSFPGLNDEEAAAVDGYLLGHLSEIGSLEEYMRARYGIKQDVPDQMLRGNFGSLLMGNMEDFEISIPQASFEANRPLDIMRGYYVSLGYEVVARQSAEISIKKPDGQILTAYYTDWKEGGSKVVLLVSVYNAW